MHVGPSARVLIGCAQGHKLAHKSASELNSQVSANYKDQVTSAIHTLDPDGTEVSNISGNGGIVNETVHASPVKIGEKSIDAEHDLQLQLLDSLTNALAKESDFSPTRYLLEQFIEFSDMHFLSEQLVMRLHNYPGYEAHLQEHTRLMKQVREIRERIIQGDKTPTLQLILELRDWLLQHIATDDAAFGDFLRKKEEHLK
jgi:hemerythrin-like metal-binding protein